MIKPIIFVGSVLLAIVAQQPREVVALDTPVEPVIEVIVEKPAPLTNKQKVEQLAEKYALKYGVSKEALMRTLANENDTFQFDRQSGLRYKAGNKWGFAAGIREKSYGVAQIHLPDNPSVSYEQAINPDFSVEFMAKKFSEGRASMWMGYTKR